MFPDVCSVVVTRRVWAVPQSHSWDGHLAPGLRTLQTGPTSTVDTQPTIGICTRWHKAGMLLDMISFKDVNLTSYGKVISKRLSKTTPVESAWRRHHHQFMSSSSAALCLSWATHQHQLSPPGPGMGPTNQHVTVDLVRPMPMTISVEHKL